MRRLLPALLLLSSPVAAEEPGVADLGRPEYAARRAAASRLFAGGTASVPALIEALKKAEAESKVRMPALAVLDDAAALRPPAALLRHLLSRITGQAFRTSDGWSAWWMGNAGKDRKALVGDALKEALGKLASKDVQERRRALETLSRIGDEGQVPQVTALLFDKDTAVRIAACRALSELGGVKPADPLRDLLSFRDPLMRREALDTASRLQLKEGRPAAAQVLGDAKRSAADRARAAEALARYSDPAALSAAASSLGRWADRNQRSRLSAVLASFPRESALEALKKALQDPKTDDPVMLAACLGVLGDRGAETTAWVDKALKAPLPAPNPKDPDKRVAARQRKLFAARVVADVFPSDSALRTGANAAFRELTQDVNDAVDRGVKALKAMQVKESKGKSDLVAGCWPFQMASWSGPGFKPGPTALALLALRKSGVPEDDPDFALGMKYIREQASRPPVTQDSTIYAQAMIAMLLSDIDPYGSKESVKRIVEWIQANPITAKTEPSKAGQWSYGGEQNSIRASNSVTHYALLGLCFASRSLKDFEVKREVWQTTLDFFLRMQRLNGGWGYDKGAGQGDAYGTMTGVGATSLLICQAGLLGEGFQEFDAGEYRPVRDGLDWLADHFEDGQVPQIAAAGNGAGGLDFRYYWCYTVERMSLLMGTEYVGSRHWYHDLASRLLEIQGPTGAWTGTQMGEVAPVSTSFALLTLKRAPLPIQIQAPKTYDVEEAK